MASVPTANYAWDKPSGGDADWHTTWNDDWDALDTGLFIEHNADYTHKAITLSGNADLNGNDLIIDTDGDSYLHESADDVVDLVLAGASGEFAININAAEDFTFTANSFNVLAGSTIVMSGNFDLNGQDLLLDADGDSYLHESADDVIDLVLAGATGELAININAAEDFTFTANAFNVLSGSSIVQADGIHFLGDTANAKMTLGLTIKAGANDDEHFALKNSDVGHAATNIAEADTFCRIQKAEAAAGGALITGLKDGDGVAGLALELQGILDEAAADTAKTTAGIGIIALTAQLESANGVGDAGANENLVIIRNNATTRFIFDVEGSAHGDVEWVAFDKHDDVALLTALETEFDARKAVTNEFGKVVGRNKELLQKAGIVNFYDDGPRAMINFTRLSMLMVGALRQLGQKIQRYEDVLIQLGIEPALLTT